jgi:hypothetical protein
VLCWVVLIDTSTRTSARCPCLLLEKAGAILPKGSRTLLFLVGLSRQIRSDAATGRGTLHSGSEPPGHWQQGPLGQAGPATRTGQVQV